MYYIDVYINISKYIYSFDENKSSINWIYKIAKNLTINTNNQLLKDTCSDYEIQNLSCNYEEDFAIQNVRDILCTLPDMDREIIQLLYYEGKTLRQIAQETNKSLATTQRKVHKILAMLKILSE